MKAVSEREKHAKETGEAPPSEGQVGREVLPRVTSPAAVRVYTGARLWRQARVLAAAHQGRWHAGCLLALASPAGLA